MKKTWQQLTELERTEVKKDFNNWPVSTLEKMKWEKKTDYSFSKPHTSWCGDSKNKIKGI
jgi:hypothetical protein